MIDLTEYPDQAVLTTDEAREWLFPQLSVAAGRRKVISLGAEPLPVTGRQHSWLAGDLRRRMLGLDPMPRGSADIPAPRRLEVLAR